MHTSTLSGLLGDVNPYLRNAFLWSSRGVGPRAWRVCRLEGHKLLARALGDVLARAHHPDGLPGVIDHHRPAGLQDHKPSLGVIASPL